MECGECTLCCKLLNIPWMNSPANSYCKECNIGVGCKIQKTKDKKCSDFECSYSQSKKVHINLRPDNCKIIFEKISNNLFYGTQDPDFEITDVAKGQINSFVNQGFSVLVTSSKIKEPLLILSKNHTADIINNDIKEYLNKRDN